MLDNASLPDPDHAVVIRSLGKQFGEKIAVNGINLTIPAGSFYGVVGPNGAGKTTAMSMMTGLLRPDHGQVWVHGLNMWETPIEAKGILGVLVDGAVSFPRLTGAQLVTYSGLLRGMDADVVAERVPDLMRVMDLEESANKMVADYSAGMTKKISLAAAMIHSPKVLILDEPFEAVDPVSSARIRNILNDYVQSGGTVMISSHVMDLVERMCDHVAVIDKGEVLASGPMAEVTGAQSLEDRFVGMVSSDQSGEGLSWFHT
ncbi:MAG: ABC transporter ATP-binding protein [Yaniella sp.]|mgnify:FL=1|uniref:ABC transporter ATP-binding protein n=1 Tax=Yaniella sp. TaxID=2773929 RepID=UPI002649B24C|nr:ABC transporter ATP-binding protein [Yaniella sp.]MDN5704727.1 ABC transporter ATP-binding protein [Yaniella sp.]MDN5816490.1 ABC transporter ATP-binding protein [Yaniella sp.]MDN5817333.1 ABC transporter ATP-binding protein [Yaniella sp.]MDN5839275.1 ABC transporter ATP-binding protein [Yaniella sp.]MDN5911222.1 ABC transporter ATP-binding protein [Yaniella sp.]